jgi:hypothetical protein
MGKGYGSGSGQPTERNCASGAHIENNLVSVGKMAAQISKKRKVMAW